MKQRILISTIMRMMSSVETKANRIFSEIDSQFETEIFQAIDSKSLGRLHSVISRLDRMIEGF